MMTRTALAGVAQVTPAAVSQFERGDSRPVPQTLVRLADALNFPVRFFIASAVPSSRILDGQLEVANLDNSDWARIAELVITYGDLRLGGTDASVITLAERRGTNRIATLNHRDFTVVRPRHAEVLELLP